jgi:excisionase family DNA binding protein
MVTFIDVSSHGYGPDDLLPIGDAARILGVSVNTVRRWEREGKLAATRTLGGQRRFRLGDLTALLPPTSARAS